MEDSFKDTTNNRFISVEDSVDTSVSVANYIKDIDFKLDASLKEEIKKAQETHVKNCSDLQFSTMQYTKMNRSILKSYKLSPDSIMQLAIQLAFYHLYKVTIKSF